LTPTIRGDLANPIIQQANKYFKPETQAITQRTISNTGHKTIKQHVSNCFSDQNVFLFSFFLFFFELLQLRIHQESIQSYENNHQEIKLN
jgi:hypothetical protein